MPFPGRPRNWTTSWCWLAPGWLAVFLLVSGGGCGLLENDSPEQAFLRLKEAAAAENWGGILSALDDQSQMKLLGIHWAVVAVASLVDKEAEELLRKHDAPLENVLGRALLGLLVGEAELKKIAGEIEQKMKAIRNRSEFLRETNNWLQARRLGDHSFLSQIRRTELKQVQAQDGTAYAELTEPILFNQTQIRFRRAASRWLVVL